MIVHVLTVAILHAGCRDRIQVGATDSEARAAVLENEAASVVNTKNPTVESTKIGYLEVRVTFFESSASSDLAFRRKTGTALRGSAPEDAPTVSRQ